MKLLQGRSRIVPTLTVVLLIGLNLFLLLTITRTSVRRTSKTVSEQNFLSLGFETRKEISSNSNETKGESWTEFDTLNKLSTLIKSKKNLYEDLAKDVINEIYRELVAGKDKLGLASEFLDKEVARGRLSEIYKKAPVVTLNEAVVYEVKQAFAAADANRKPSRKADGEKLMIHGDNASWPIWKQFHNHMRRHQLYSEEDGLVDKLLDNLRTANINEVSRGGFPGGTSLKIQLSFDDGSKAVFKPLRFPRDQHGWPDHFYFNAFERHYAEIAAFNVDRLMGFRRVPPTIGRVLNFSSEFETVCADHRIKESFFTSAAGNRCFFGKCDAYCDIGHPVCAHDGFMEVSVMAWLPSMSLPGMWREEYYNPYRGSYKPDKLPPWRTDPTYCDTKVRPDPWMQSRRFMDVIDLGIFDFLVGNKDRHHYDTMYRKWGNDTHMIVYDNGRGFHLSKFDDMDAIYSLRQCCQIRISTLEKLIEFGTGPIPLSSAMREKMKSDPIAPVLTEDYLDALDRRVKLALKEVAQCLTKHEASFVIVDDGL